MHDHLKKLGIGFEGIMQGILDWDLEFEVHGKPKALKRHRSFKKGEFIGQYDPSAGDKGDFLSKAMENKPIVPFDEPLYVKLTFYFPRPKAHFRTGKKSHILKESAPYWHSSTPDGDNILKFLGDALNNVFWKDDKFISKTEIDKVYDAVPRIKIQVLRLHKLQVCIDNNLL